MPLNTVLNRFWNVSLLLFCSFAGVALFYFFFRLSSVCLFFSLNFMFYGFALWCYKLNTLNYHHRPFGKTMNEKKTTKKKISSVRFLIFIKSRMKPHENVSLLNRAVCTFNFNDRALLRWMLSFLLNFNREKRMWNLEGCYCCCCCCWCYLFSIFASENKKPNRFD